MKMVEKTIRKREIRELVRLMPADWDLVETGTALTGSS